jgi:spore germination protein YaaH
MSLVGQIVGTLADGTRIFRLPPELRAPVVGGCDCHYCKTHPDQIPQWDTLAVPAVSHTYTVHHPEMIRHA